MTKKIVSFLLSIVMVVGMAACGSGNGTGPAEKKQQWANF